MKAKRNKNFLRRAAQIQQMVADYYQPENQSHSKIQAFRNVVYKVYPMSERSFWRYMNAKIEKEKEN